MKYLKMIFANLKSNGYQIICSDVKGKNIFSYQTNKKSIITFSNEANGPSEMVRSLC